MHLHGFGCAKRFLVHRLVAAAFVANATESDRREINHLNAIKSDNNYMNLEWATRLENMRHAAERGLIPIRPQAGEHNPFSKLTDADVLEIRRRRLAGESFVTLAKDFPVSPSRLSVIASGGGWTHL